ncbi:hypothetical protein K5V21_07840 [Clostridium sardiniense]|uniref:GNAT family N-acetyltransferase n=1 Tax=Clostridium sardiniense TaxID=29369 RepID=A0ABS7KXJ2_CLOSR|nr:hypothetical protein [Clostridium sardiniense]MBY0755367.1 hypothetical protein [Clostridium sardiniense]MDQ0459813.1 hypothetical protein [Clostridium sardiniense]
MSLRIETEGLIIRELEELDSKDFIDIFNGQFRGINGAWGSDGSNKNQYFLD